MKLNIAETVFANYRADTGELQAPVRQRLAQVLRNVQRVAVTAIV